MSKKGSLHSQTTEQLVRRLAGLSGEGRFVDQTRSQLTDELKTRPEAEVKAAEKKFQLTAAQ